MSNVDNLAKEIGNLSKVERQELVKKLLEKMNKDEIIQLLEKMTDDAELMGMLKTIEPTFNDWLNEEDSVYDNL